jgi:hypothetical protein
LALDDDDKICEFEARLPVRQPVNTKPCDMKIALETRIHAGHWSILGLTIGRAPERLEFRVQRQAELIYDAILEPRYAPYATRREDDKRFCGDRALVQPVCRRGSSQCAPYAASCDGPEDCPDRKVCCVSPEWGREYGPLAAAECSGRRSCLDRLAQIACHSDAECPDDMACSDASLAEHFRAPLLACKPRTAAR